MVIKKLKKNNLIKKYKTYFRFIFFCFVGVVSTLIHFLVFNFFRFSINLTFSASLIIAIIIAIIFNFSVNRNITFSAGGYSLKKQILKYLTIYGTSSLANFIVQTLANQSFVNQHSFHIDDSWVSTS